MKVAITGGSGVVGKAVVRRLVAAGHDVSALARSETSARSLRALGSGAVMGDVVEPESLNGLVAGAEIVFHVAGVNELCTRSPDWMEKVNVQGTRNVIQACRAGGVKRLVHTSSAVTIGEEKGSVGSEASPHRGRYLSHYERTKHKAELALFDEAGALEVVAVNPSSVQGPGRVTGTGKMVLEILQGRVPVLVDTKISIVDIDDCARGHLLAAELGRPGQRYVLSGTTLGMRKAVAVLARVSGRSLSPRFAPGRVMSAGAAVVEGLARLVGRQPPVCREMVRVLRAGHAYDGSLAARELGLIYTPLEQTIERLVAWFRSEGLLD